MEGSLFFSQRFVITLSLFLIGALHTMIFAFFQFPGNFLLDTQNQNAFLCKGILYGFAIGVSLIHQLVSRAIGLRKTLYIGLLFNFMGLTTLMLYHVLDAADSWLLIILNMVFFGTALTSVINSLITYLIVEFPHQVGPWITALFAVFNGGVMLAPLLLELFRNLEREWMIYPFLMGLVLLAIWFVHVKFFDPPFPEHLIHLRKGTLIWKEMHYRLGLFLLAIIGYGITETTFSLWGFFHLKELFGQATAHETISVFWLFMIIGQLILLIPLYFYPGKRVFYLLIALVLGALFYFPLQTHLPALLIGLVLGGFGCSAIFPLLLSMVEQELTAFAEGADLLPYIETACSVLIAGYFIGVGAVDLWVEKIHADAGSAVLLYFHIAMVCIATTALSVFYLNRSSPQAPS